MLFLITAGREHAHNEFTQTAREVIGKRTLSDVICDNTNLKQVPAQALRSLKFKGNSEKSCSKKYSTLDVSKINLVSGLCDGSIHNYSWQFKCCTKDHPCEEGQGDCDSNDECEGNLVCNDNANNCRKLNPTQTKWFRSADCCTKPK